jgi:hypothetical protein
MIQKFLLVSVEFEGSTWAFYRLLNSSIQSSLIV